MKCKAWQETLELLDDKLNSYWMRNYGDEAATAAAVAVACYYIWGWDAALLAAAILHAIWPRLRD